MKVLFLSGVFGDNVERLILKASKRVEFSANLFQKKLIDGFKKSGVDFEIVSAPFIGSFPNISRIVNFKQDDESDYRYVKFCNIWGIRNFSRERQLKKTLYDFICRFY